MPLSPGARLRSFEVLGPLGAGGMGNVYRARDEKLGRFVAIKMLQERLAGSAEHLQRFKREARAASALNHPNIVTIFEIDDFAGEPFIAMELVQGRSLREILRDGRLPLRQLLDVAAQVADGLAAAHERGIVHRDLKPENVMLTAEGRVKIVDFGLARIQSTASADDSTSSLVSLPNGGAIAGTTGYMSPEQARGAEIDFRSDQFSFGSMLYELATGRRAFQRETMMETLAAIMRDEPEEARRITPSLPLPLVWIIERCLAKDPPQRYASTRDLANELSAMRRRFPETAGDHSWKRGAAIAVMAIAIIAGGAAALWTLRPQTSTLPAPAPAPTFLAVVPFEDEEGRADGQMFSMGLSEAVREELSRYSRIRMVYPQVSVSATGRSNLRRVAQELGASVLLTATVRRTNGDVAVRYSLVDMSEKKIAGRSISGSVEDIWQLRDQLVRAIAADLGIDEKHSPAPQAGLETEEEQAIYIRSIGALDLVRDAKATESAIAGLHELLETAPDSPLVHAALGRGYYNKYLLTYDRQWVERAARVCRRAVALDPNLPETLVTLGIVESIRGNYRESIASFQRALALRPTSAMAAIGLAQTLSADNRYDDAERMFRQGIALNPGWWFGHNELGTLYWHRSRYDDALREYREVIRLDPDGSWGYTNSGAVLANKGKLAEAAAMFRKATTLGEDPGAYVNLGYCHFMLGEYDKAVESIRVAVKLREAFSTYWVELGDACVWSPKYRSEARAAYETAIKSAKTELATNPKNARAHASLAIAFGKTGNLESARRSLRQAMDLDPENGEHFFRAARIENLSGNHEESIVWLKRAIGAGSSRVDLERHPEFAELRRSDAVRSLLNAGSQQ